LEQIDTHTDTLTNNKGRLKLISELCNISSSSLSKMPQKCSAECSTATKKCVFSAVMESRWFSLQTKASDSRVWWPAVVNNSNFGRISVKWLVVPTPPLFDSLLVGSMLEFLDETYPTKTRGMGLPYNHSW